MKQFLLSTFLILSLSALTTPSIAQSPAAAGKDSITRLLRIYEDNDGINIFGQWTDDAYTAGTRIDLFYQPATRPHGLLGKYALRAGDSSIDSYGWGVMQLMYTPEDLSQTTFQPNDYPYSGGLIATHARYSYNPVKHYDLQTELVMGVLGPASLAQQTQSLVHRLTGFMEPKGWGTQFRNAPLLNINITAEKQLFAAGNTLRIIGGGQLYAGTMQNGAAVYPLILLGKMAPYFDGFFSQYTSPGRDHRGRKKWQLYFMAKPELQYFLTNALLEGGVFSTNPNKPKYTASIPALQPLFSTFAFGGVLTYGRLGISFVQNVSSAALKGLYCHDVGNVSVYFGW
ncbi:lipid A deacylase LpxR family protein [Puia dinghuensis]|uniref:Lipid A deacylase LpxR family protein n=1 Tax=Puia dinghuensis TaxID=1792502 RepID=A0A8J2XRM7_9BACT|nr:lipid A deacylase LpxR family protein [Puia dinghuensis]GGA87480.1 hypothetical protein GCM10011511_08340 [Puia dinghuensis]